MSQPTAQAEAPAEQDERDEFGSAMDAVVNAYLGVVRENASWLGTDEPWSVRINRAFLAYAEARNRLRALAGLAPEPDPTLAE